MAGAGLLVIAEFTPLFSVRADGPGNVLITVQTGSHHAHALIGVALLAALLAMAWYRSPGRPAMMAIGVMGAVALVIAIAHDWPGAHAAGLVRTPGGAYVSASSRAGAGLYLETLGGIVLLIAGAAGLLLAPGLRRRRSPARRDSVPRTPGDLPPERSAS